MAFMEISTHAPAGGATVGAGDGLTVAVISTHAPAGGATKSNYMASAAWYFYSRPCGRGDS